MVSEDQEDEPVEDNEEHSEIRSQVKELEEEDEDDEDEEVEEVDEGQEGQEQEEEEERVLADEALMESEVPATLSSSLVQGESAASHNLKWLCEGLLVIPRPPI